MGTLTISTTGAQDARIAKAFGAELQLGGSANAAQVRQAVIDHIKAVVKKYEINEATKAANALVETIVPIDVT
jgi:transcription elongation factor GreA-like protein